MVGPPDPVKGVFYMQLRQLQYFVAVAEQLSFRKAAEILYVTQPLLSKQIADLEDEVGYPLFIRNTRSVSLTAAGEVMLTEANKLIRQSESLLSNVKNAAKYGEAYGLLRIGYEESYPHEMIGVLFNELRENYPTIDLQVHRYTSNELTNALQKNFIDIGFMLLPEKHIGKHMESKIMACDTLSMAVSSLLVERGSPIEDYIRLAEDLPICLLEKNAKGLNSITNLCQSMNIYANYIFAETIQDMLVYAESGFAISVMPQRFLQYPDYSLLSYAPIKSQDAELCMAAVWNKDNPSTPRTTFLKMCSSIHVDCIECSKTWCCMYDRKQVS